MLSFGFTKSKAVKKLKSSSAIDESNTFVTDDIDYLISVEDSLIKSVKPESVKAPLVIPLKQSNQWLHAKKPDKSESVKGCCDTMEAPEKVYMTDDERLADIATNEILSDAAILHGKSSDNFHIDTNFTIPLILQHNVPNSCETENHLDVCSPSEEEHEEDYEKVPIEQFGLAMLRGMGWKDGEGVGKKQKTVKPVEPVIRPKGLGLGADKSVVMQTSGIVRQSNIDVTNEEQLFLKKGSHCMFVSGKHDGQFGTVVGIDEDNARVMVALAVGGEMVNVTQFAIKLVSKKEFDKFSKYINKGKIDRYKMVTSGNLQDSSETFKKSEHYQNSHPHQNIKADEHRDLERYKCGSKQHKIIKCHEVIMVDSEAHKCKPKSASDGVLDHKNLYDSECSSDGILPARKHKHDCIGNANDFATVWIRPNLRVRIIDRSYRNGKFYKLKVIVVDVISADNCICRTDDGQVLDDVKQSQLETVIPHHTPSYVMIVSGKYRMRLAQLVQRNKDNCSAVVQLLCDHDVALTMDFDHICEYAADIDDDDF